MAITKYLEDGKEYYRVYLHYRSKLNRTRRIQKTLFRIESENEARREEKKLIQQCVRELERMDGKGLNWSDVVHLWKTEVQAGYIAKITERSLDGYLSIIYKWTRHWDDLIAANITKSQGRELITMLQNANSSWAYQKKIKNIVNKVYEWGIEYGHISGVKEGPLRGLILEKKEETPPEILSLEEIKRFLTAAQAVGHRWYPIWAFAVLTGMRNGELYALCWEQIDLQKDTILVDRSFDVNTQKIGPTKGRYWRTVPISSDLKKLIIEIQGETTAKTTDYVLPRIKDWDNGDQATVLRSFLESIKMKSIRFHALRACFATQMLASGVSAPVVMKIGGWKKSATMDIYLRLAGVDVKGATDCLKFIPSQITFGGNVVNMSDWKQRGTYEQ